MKPSALVTMGGPKWPDGDKLRAVGVERVYYEGRDPQISAPFFASLRSVSYETGAMFDPSWIGYSKTPELWIEQVSLEVSRLAPASPTTGKRPPFQVMLDMEIHDPAWVLAALQRFQSTNPGRNVVWTLEHGQAGWWTPDLVSFVNSYPQLRVCPQLYNGPMTYTVDSHASARNLIGVGVHDDRIAFVHSLREPLVSEWDGVLFLENWQQLPSR